MYEDYSIQVFMNAWFKKDYSELSEEDFKIVRAEYEDTSGLYLTQDFEQISYINHISQRINYVKLFVKLQRDFIQEFDIPFLRDFPSFKDKYGYNLKWNDDIEDFEKQLKRVESRELKNDSHLKEKLKEFKDSKKNEPVKEVENEDSIQKSRISFIRMLNSLGKIGYKFDKLLTSVEELSLMIKQQLEEIK